MVAEVMERRVDGGRVDGGRGYSRTQGLNRACDYQCRAGPTSRWLLAVALEPVSLTRRDRTRLPISSSCPPRLTLTLFARAACCFPGRPKRHSRTPVPSSFRSFPHCAGHENLSAHRPADPPLPLFLLTTNKPTDRPGLFPHHPHNTNLLARFLPHATISTRPKVNRLQSGIF